RGSTCLIEDAKVPGIYKPDVVCTLTKPFCIRTHRIGRRPEQLRLQRHRMRFAFVGRLGVAAMAIRASETNRFRYMHRLGVHVTAGACASCGFSCRLLAGLGHESRRLLCEAHEDRCAEYGRKEKYLVTSLHISKPTLTA